MLTRVAVDSHHETIVSSISRISRGSVVHGSGIYRSSRGFTVRRPGVLEIGRGVGTDGVQFSRQGASYLGVELSPRSVTLAKEQFDLLGLSGMLAVANAESSDLKTIASTTFTA
jgi:hypothetical protein